PKRQSVVDDSWFEAVPAIKRGDVDFAARQLISGILRPRLEVEKAFRWGDDLRDLNAPETLHDLLRLEFDPADHPPATDILAVWPKPSDQEIALFRSLDGALLDALEEAQDVGLLVGFDRTSHDVPSVAAHPQNAHHSGFYPITRALADLWIRIVERDAARGR